MHSGTTSKHVAVFEMLDWPFITGYRGRNLLSLEIVVLLESIIIYLYESSLHSGS